MKRGHPANFFARSRSLSPANTSVLSPQYPRSILIRPVKVRLHFGRTINERSRERNRPTERQHPKLRRTAIPDSVSVIAAGPSWPTRFSLQTLDSRFDLVGLLLDAEWLKKAASRRHCGRNARSTTAFSVAVYHPLEHKAPARGLQRANSGPQVKPCFGAGIGAPTLQADAESAGNRGTGQRELALGIGVEVQCAKR